MYCENEKQLLTTATRPARQRWFSVGIFQVVRYRGLTSSCLQSVSACSFHMLPPKLTERRAMD